MIVRTPAPGMLKAIVCGPDGLRGGQRLAQAAMRDVARPVVGVGGRVDGEGRRRRRRRGDDGGRRQHQHRQRQSRPRAAPYPSRRRSHRRHVEHVHADLPVCSCRNRLPSPAIPQALAWLPRRSRRLMAEGRSATDWFFPRHRWTGAERRPAQGVPENAGSSPCHNERDFHQKTATLFSSHSSRCPAVCPRPSMSRDCSPPGAAAIGRHSTR